MLVRSVKELSNHPSGWFPWPIPFSNHHNVGSILLLPVILFASNEGNQMRLCQIEPETGAHQDPHRDTDGCFVLGNPMYGNRQHDKDVEIRVTNEVEMINLVRAGCSVQVSDGADSHWARKNLFLDGVRLT